VNAVLALAYAVLTVMIAKGIYSLQWWLERSDYNRHFED
jgi:hypothetical protein